MMVCVCVCLVFIDDGDAPAVPVYVCVLFQDAVTPCVCVWSFSLCWLLSVRSFLTVRNKGNDEGLVLIDFRHECLVLILPVLVVQSRICSV